MPVLILAPGRVLNFRHGHSEHSSLSALEQLLAWVLRRNCLGPRDIPRVAFVSRFKYDKVTE